MKKKPAYLLAVSALVAAVMAGCSGGAEPSSSPGTDQSSNSAFPVTVETARGPITVKEKPKRILVVMTASAVDMLDAIGSPAAVYSSVFEGEAAEAYVPWIADRYGELDNTAIVDRKPNAEAIAELKPDLIVLLSNPLWSSDEVIEQLQTVAPTFVMDQDWRVSLKALGQLTGQNDEADAVLEETDQLIADSKAKLPGLQGKTLNGVYYMEDGFRMTPSYELLEELGMKLADNQPTVEAKKDISSENLPELSGDVLIVIGGENEKPANNHLENDPRFADLPAVKNGTYLWLTRSEGAALEETGPAATKYVLDQIVPKLQASQLNQAK